MLPQVTESNKNPMATTLTKIRSRHTSFVLPLGAVCWLLRNTSLQDLRALGLPHASHQPVTKILSLVLGLPLLHLAQIVIGAPSLDNPTSKIPSPPSPSSSLPPWTFYQNGNQLMMGHDCVKTGLYHHEHIKELFDYQEQSLSSHIQKASSKASRKPSAQPSSRSCLQVHRHSVIRMLFFHQILMDSSLDCLPLCSQCKTSMKTRSSLLDIDPLLCSYASWCLSDSVFDLGWAQQWRLKSGQSDFATMEKITLRLFVKPKSLIIESLLHFICPWFNHMLIICCLTSSLCIVVSISTQFHFCLNSW